ncbi:ROK family protein [Sphingomonas sp. DT-204]|uniref:ROK family protein n=1 Tax=Sphingomonas sp. DT-204 TaxID=3396166 RepID=UPI003F1D9A0F
MAFLGIETGGTKILARVVAEDGVVVGEGRWTTTVPDAAADAILGCVETAGVAIAAGGIAAFGPLIVNPALPNYGEMLDTPKPGWTGSNLRAVLADRLDCPVAVDTDVNVAAIAEQALGAGRGLGSVAYVTVGTGIGAGLAIDGRALVGALHPEAGHIRLVRAAGDDAPSTCPFHPDCAEGLTAGPAVRQRLKGRTLPEAPEVAALVAHYLGQLLAALVFAWSPQRIVMGGGVMTTPGLLDATAGELRAALGGYGVGPAANAPDFVVPAMLENAGLEGALLMARRAVSS